MKKMRLRKKAGGRIKYYKVCKLAVANNNNRVVLMLVALTLSETSTFGHY